MPEGPLFEEHELIWDDRVAAEMCLDFDASFVPKGEVREGGGGKGKARAKRDNLRRLLSRVDLVVMLKPALLAVSPCMTGRLCDGG